MNEFVYVFAVIVKTAEVFQLKIETKKKEEPSVTAENYIRTIVPNGDMYDVEWSFISEEKYLSNSINRETYISFGSSHVYPWMGGVNPNDVLVRILNQSHEEARKIAFEVIGDKWSTSYSYLPIKAKKIVDIEEIRRGDV